MSARAASRNVFQPQQPNVSSLLRGAQAENDRLRKTNEALEKNRTNLIGTAVVLTAAAATAGFFYGNPAAFNATVDYVKGFPSAIASLFASTVDPAAVVAKAQATSDAAATGLPAALTACGTNETCQATAQQVADAAKKLFDDVTAAKGTLDAAQAAFAACKDATCKAASTQAVTAAQTAFNTLAALVN